MRYPPCPGAQAYWNKLKEILRYFVPLFRYYIMERNEASQLQCLRALADELTSKQDLAKCMGPILQFLYDKDVLSDEVITKCFSNVKPDSVIWNLVVSSI